MAHLIITNCTSRKRDIGNDPLLPRFEKTGTVHGALAQWVEMVNSSKIVVNPLDLYQGRSISECRLASRRLSAGLYVVSAGLGLVSASDLIPNYSLTISEGSGSIQNWLALQNINSADWWLQLCHAFGMPTPISSLIGSISSNDRILIALPSRYLQMIASDLALIDPNQHANLRFFTSIAGAKFLPSALKSFVMPYDERLEGIPQHNGTRSDFPQRALKHFVTNLQAQDHPLGEAKYRVASAMESSQLRANPVRTKASDAQIAELILGNWKVYGGSATKLLRFLRDDAKVACEQSRFSGIWRKVLAQHNR
jgi:hypothetical protein